MKKEGIKSPFFGKNMNEDKEDSKKAYLDKITSEVFAEVILSMGRNGNLNLKDPEQFIRDISKKIVDRATEKFSKIDRKDPEFEDALMALCFSWFQYGCSQAKDELDVAIAKMGNDLKKNAK